MAKIGRNENDKISKIRDYFLGVESEYLKELLTNEDNVSKIYDYMNMPLKLILQKVKSIIVAMELGAFKDENDQIIIIDEKFSAKLEKQLVLLLASIDDVEMAKILELTPKENGLGV